MLIITPMSKLVNPLKRIFLNFSLLFSGFGVEYGQGGEFMTSIGNKSVMAKNLTYYVNLSGKTQKELSEAVGVATSTFNDWMKGKKYPRIDKIEALANYFGILKSNLIEDRDKETSPNELPLTEGEKKWLELYHQLSNETREVLVNVANNFEKLPTDTQNFLLGAIRVALNNQK